jgi:hypothetical protein
MYAPPAGADGFTQLFHICHGPAVWTHGSFWRKEDIPLPIFVKELKAVKFGLLEHVDVLQGSTVRLFQDNQAVVGAMRAFSNSSPAMMVELSEIWSLLDLHQISFTIEYIRSELNPADAPSRLSSPVEPLPSYATSAFAPGQVSPAPVSLPRPLCLPPLIGGAVICHASVRPQSLGNGLPTAQLEQRVCVALSTVEPHVLSFAQASSSRMQRGTPHLPLVASPALVAPGLHPARPSLQIAASTIHCQATSFWASQGRALDQPLPRAARCGAQPLLWRPSFSGARFLRCVPSLQAALVARALPYVDMARPGFMSAAHLLAHGRRPGTLNSYEGKASLPGLVTGGGQGPC